MSDIKFEFKDNRVKVLRAAKDNIDALLLEVSAELVTQVAQNTAVDTGQLKSSWAAEVTNTDTEYTAVIGSPLENAIWEEFGTGEYALNGDGRKGGWLYENADGDTVFTRGKRPRRAFHKAYTTLKSKLIKHMQSEFKRRMV